jgi:two-component system, OmpR family, sensor kinase
MTARVAVAGRRAGRSVEEGRLDAFAANAAHSVGAGVSVASGYATLLRERFGESLGPEGLTLLDGLEGGFGRLRVFMGDLLELAALDEMPIDRAALDARAVATAAVAGLAGPIDAADVEVDVGLLPPVTADARMLERLFHHLLRGGLAAIGPGPGRIGIAGAAGAAGAARIEVTDSGPALDRDTAAGLFDAFAPPRGSGAAVGAGVGMAIARRIVERHGGSIRARDGSGDGCTIVALLPANGA